MSEDKTQNNEWRDLTLDEAAGILKDWMVDQYGKPTELDPEQRDQWDRDNGLIYHFLCHLIAE